MPTHICAGPRPASRTRGLFLGLAALSLAAFADPAAAYDLYKVDDCSPNSPGQKWDSSRPVTVQLLADSFIDYLDTRGGATGEDYLAIARDIQAVIDAYNGIPGNSLVLELGPGIGGDSNIQLPEVDNFGDQTIVIGFTNLVAASSATAEAWAPGALSDKCTRTRAHVLFRKLDNNGKAFDWIFGPPDDTEVNGRQFTTAAQPGHAGAGKAISFLGILTHEMGHAVGLGHPHDDYAVMAQGFRTWFRGPNHALRTRLLPDDAAGILALYQRLDTASAAKTNLDISVTNSWFKVGDDPLNCTAQQTAANAADLAVARQQTAIAGLQGAGLQRAKDLLAQLQVDAGIAAEALLTCLDSAAANQTQNCKVSSRADVWADRSAGLVYCGVNAEEDSAYPPAGSRVCPGAFVQLRYTLNNHSMYRDVTAATEMWLSSTTRLIARPGQALKSPDVREFTVAAGRSNTIGQTFRAPADALEGETYHVFVRAVPTEPGTGADLWASDADQWNNALMMRGRITVSSAACG